MAITYADSTNLGNAFTSNGSFTVSGSTVAVGDLLIFQYQINGVFGSLQNFATTDNINSGNWSTGITSFNAADHRQYTVMYMICNAAGAVTTISVPGLNGNGIIAYYAHYSGFTGTATLIDSNQTHVTSAAVAATSINTSKNNELFIAVGGTISGTAWSVSPASPWNIRNASNFSSAGLQDQIVATAGTSVGLTGTLAGSDLWYVNQLGFYDFVASVFGEGTSTGATTAATGQGAGGVAMPAITGGQEIDVLVGIQNSSLPSTLTVSDGSNTYTQIDNFNDAGNGFIWYRFACRVITPLSTPTLTATANAGYFPTSMSIAAAPLNGITGFTAGYVAHNQQLSPGGTDAQVSGFTPSLLGGPGINYTVAAFGFSASKATSPAAGTGFSQVATAWSALGTGACLTYETKQLGSGGAPVQATFTPTTGRAYTLVAAFNNIQFPVSPAGPMPRQIYIMP